MKKKYSKKEMIEAYLILFGMCGLVMSPMMVLAHIAGVVELKNDYSIHSTIFLVSVFALSYFALYVMWREMKRLKNDAVVSGAEQ